MGVALGATMIAFGGFVLVLENSEELLIYHRNTPPPMTATKVKKTIRMLRHDFMADF